MITLYRHSAIDANIESSRKGLITVLLKNK